MRVVREWCYNMPPSCRLSPHLTGVTSNCHMSSASLVSVGKFLQLVENHRDILSSLSFSTDSQWLASGPVDTTVIVWGAMTGRRLAGPFIGYSTGHGEKLASCDLRIIRICNKFSGKLVIRPINLSAHSLVWSPDGEQLYVGWVSHPS